VVAFLTYGEAFAGIAPPRVLTPPFLRRIAEDRRGKLVNIRRSVAN
jgi:hypothetical protein